MSVKIVVVEDEEDILELIEYNLTKEGYEVIGFLNTKSVAQMLIEESIDLLIMDRNLPGVEGSEFVQALRKEGFVTPVIYLSAKSQDFEIEEGFLRGADDYITKPFNMKELLLRIKALLRRTSKKVEEGVLAYRDLLLDKSSRTLSVDGENVNVTINRLKEKIDPTKSKNYIQTVRGVGYKLC